MDSYMNSYIREAELKLIRFQQEHVLKVMANLPEENKHKLASQVMAIDFQQLRQVLHDHHEQKETSGDHLTPIPYEDWADYSTDEKASFEELGWEFLRGGAIGAIVVAGGQGSRLGHDGPKGTLDIGLPSRKSLFQLQAERLLHLSRKAGRSIPWYIMTSPDNHEETVSFFRSSHYFNYPAEDCFFFEQNTMPALDHNGKLLLSMDGMIKMAPSGNGECFASLKRSGAVADMKRRGLQWLFYYNVDNTLIKVADPTFIGVAAARNNNIATKVIEKTNADEKIGIVGLKNDRPAVIEYSEIPAAVKDRKSQDGRLFFHLGHISIHLFKLDFIVEHADTSIPFHVASKKIEYMDEGGNLISPVAPNAYKFERFIFDFFPFAEQLTVLMGKREEEFAPVKNKLGEDSPISARELLLTLHHNWLLAAGVSKQQLQERDIEISPLVSYGGEGLESYDKSDHI